MSVRIIHGDCRDVLPTLAAESVHSIVCSPPYFGLRDYGVDGQIGLEQTPDAFVAELVGVFRKARRVLRADGTLWVNIGDSYAGSWGAQSRGEAPGPSSALSGGQVYADPRNTHTGSLKKTPGLKPKDLIGIPWMLAFALRADGWYLRGDHVWGKPNSIPESMRDRPTRAHEYVFLLSKSERYYYDQEAVRTAPKASTITQLAKPYTGQSTKDHDGAGVQNASDLKRRIVDKQRGHTRRHAGFNDRWDAMERTGQMAEGGNLRSVWWISPAQSRENHFAVMPDMVAEICIRAGCPEGGTVLDPFGGVGTTGLVADRLGRNAVLIELNPDSRDAAEARIRRDAPMLAEISA